MRGPRSLRPHITCGAQQWDTAKRSARQRRDDELRGAIQRVRDENEQAHGPRKVWKQLWGEGHCTVEPSNET